MHHFFKNEWLDFETVRILVTAPYGGADVAEVLEAVGDIKHVDPARWQAAWATQARRAEALAEEARKSGDTKSARQAYLRASNYTRASGYMLVGNGPDQPDPALLHVVEKVSELFKKAATLFESPVHFLDIPYDDGPPLPATLYLPRTSHRLSGQVPILISNGGADALQEELYYMHPSLGPELGYAVLTFEGPGQGIVLRKHNRKMRPDWEMVVQRVIDGLESFAASHGELNLDLDRVAIAGASLGGYFALRAAVGEPRLKACVALDPIYSMWDFATAHVSPTFIGAWNRGWLSNGMVDRLIGLMMRFSFQMQWEVSLSGTFYGLSSPAEIMLEMKKYSLVSTGGRSLLEGVQCPVLVSGAASSLYVNADHHTMRAYNALTGLKESKGEKQVWMSPSPGQGALQAKMGAMQLANQRTFRFLDEHLGITREALLEEH
ncbi:MAG: hypothetical protein L6R39_000499 [Caloplaca ligustica]|nr:MAG: hypothetical protein L6R39_000499 [Caloplaca ligustica]